MRRFVFVAALVLASTVLVYTGLNTIGLMPIEASAQSVSIDRLFNLEVIAISFLFSLIVVPLVYSLIVFRRRPGETGDGAHFDGNSRLEIVWTVVPLITVLAFAYLGAQSLGETRRVDPQAMQISVTGIQWAWSFNYPDYGIQSNELYLPVNQQVLLNMTSQDVIHSFWVPEFRVKQDLVPGRTTEYRITPTLIGDYKVRCAELCGTSHAYMLAPIHVVSEADFQAWVQKEQAAAAAAASGSPDPTRGQQLYENIGCKACHSLDGSAGVGPSWKGLFGSEVELNDGTKVTADEAYIVESIKNPGAKIVNGYQAGAMPQFSLTDAQINDIVAFIKTVK
jgi:cytochrome c oxidase subunit 2